VQAGTALDDAEQAVRLADLDPGRAIPTAARAAGRARRAGDDGAVAIAERAWGHALLHCGEMDAAIRHLRLAISYGLRAGSPALAGEAQMKLAHAMVQRGRPEAALVAIDAALVDLDGASLARAQAQRAIILHLSGRLDEALAGFNAALPALRRAGDQLGIQRMLINRAFLHADQHAFTAAHADLSEAERLARRLGRDLTIGIIAANRGFFDTLRGDVPAALAHFDRAETITRAHGAHLGTIHQDRSELLLSVGLLAEARAAAELAVAAYQQERRLLKVPEARLLLAQAALLDRDRAAATAHARTAMREFARQRRTEWAELARLTTLRAALASDPPPATTRGGIGRVDTMVDVLTGSGWPAAALEARLVAARLAGGSVERTVLRRVHGDQDRLAGGTPGRTAGRTTGRTAGRREDAARAHLSEASRARLRGPATLRARGWYAQALLRVAAADPRGAVGAARAGLRILDQHAAALGATDLRAHSAIHRTDLAELGLRMALDGGRPAQVFEWAERGRASQLLHRPVRPPEDEELAALLAELRGVAQELGESGPGTGRQAAARLGRRQVELERRIRDHVRLRPGSPGGALPAPVPAGRLGADLGAAALVEFMQLDGVLHGLSLAGGRLRLRRLGPVAPVADLVERLPFALHRMARPGIDPGGAAGRSGSHAAAVALLAAAADRLDAALLGPFARELGDRPLVVVPTGALHSVPWSILPSCRGRPVTVSPSATLWHGARLRAAPQTAASAAGAVGAVLAAAGPRLRGAHDEAIAVAAIHGSTPLVGGAATVDAVLAGLGAAGLAHLAAHGRLSADNPLFSDLLLADGPLVVYDLERLARVPPTVVLAACDSGRSVVRTGDELLGLGATFIGRGAAQLVASVLPVPDAETAPLMVAFHRRLAAGDPPAVALAAAQQRLAGELPAPATVAAAAGFVCIGFGFGGGEPRY